MSQALQRTYDGIIIGAGHHGLVLGSYLAKAGLDILLVDRRLTYGGGLNTTEATLPGFYHNLHSINHFHITETPWFKDLGLSARVDYITPRYEFGQAHADGTALVLGRDLEETVANIARFSKRDADTFRAWNAQAEEMTARILIPERYAEPLPQAEREALLSRTALGRDFLSMANRQPLDVVRELFENEHVQLLFLFKVSLFGTWLTDTLSKTSPMGSVIRAFDLQTGYQLCQGGSFNLARGLMETFIAAGGTFAPQVALERIVIEGGRASGVALASGEIVPARRVVANVNPKLLFERLVAPGDVDADFRARMAAYRCGSGTFRMNVALSELPDFLALRGTDAQPHHASGIIVAPSLEYMERAYFDARTDGWSRAPIVEMLIPSVVDDTLAPAGQHVASLFCQHVHPDIGVVRQGRTWDDFRDAVADVMIAAVDAVAPNFARSVIARRSLTPLDLERDFGLVGGDIFHGALGLDQLFSTRPVLGNADYRMPIRGLYLCGSGAHPGGGVSGIPGRNAAREILRDVKRRR